MSFTPAKIIISSQQGPHTNLEMVVAKHLSHQNRKPIAEHTLQAYELSRDYWQRLGSPVFILDSACGTAESSRYLAALYPQHLVIGIDQSAARLGHADNLNLPENCLLLQADCTDFWRLCVLDQWRCDKHFLLYPNPYPKPAHLQRRWHGHPAFPDLLSISEDIELRTNWATYAEEFQLAVQQCQRQATLQTIELENSDAAMTAFERKYDKSDHQLWRVLVSGRAVNSVQEPG